MTITIKQTTQTLINGKWQTAHTLEKEISRAEYSLIVANRAKGDRYYKTYTPIGYVPYKIISRFEDLKTIREFTFSD